MAVEKGVTPSFIEWVDERRVICLSYKKKAGFLHTVKDSLEMFDGNCIKAYLNALLAFVFRVLQTCQLNFHTQNLEGGD